MAVLITVLAPDEDGEAILQLLSDTKYVVMSTHIDTEEPATTGPLAPSRHGPRTRSKPISARARGEGTSTYAERPLGEMILDAATKGPITREDAEAFAVSVGYAKTTGTVYLSGLTSREGKLRRVTEDGETLWYLNK